MNVVSLVTDKPKEKIMSFRVDYKGTIVYEIIPADNMGVTEELKEFVTFYESYNSGDELICMINKDSIRKITVVEREI